MELYGLKDKKGNDVTLDVEIDQSTTNLVWKIKYIKDTEPKPEFKVGQWVYYINPPHMKGMDAIFRIADIHDCADKGRFRLFSGDEGGWYEADYCRLATREEIESHLINIAQKGYPIGTKYIYGGKEYIVRNKFRYYDDLYITDGVRGDIGAVYDNGKWAEIVPQKKKLPKTKEEYVQFLKDFDKSMLPDDMIRDRIRPFLDQYED